MDNTTASTAASSLGGGNYLPTREHFDSQTHRHIGDPGRPTMKGMLKKERGGGYTKYTILSDIIDESMLNCMKNHGHLMIDFHPSSVDERKLSSIIIYDDINDGFVGLDKDGDKNPLNLIHYGGDRHTSDEEWSQWGVGLTAASMCCSSSWVLTTRYKMLNGTFKYVRLTFRWEEMARLDTVAPEIVELSEADYNTINPFHKGSVFEYTDCFSDIFSGNYKKNVKQLVKMISTKYYKALMCASEDDNDAHVTYRTFNSNGDEISENSIEPDIPPTEQDNHPHTVYKCDIQIRQNENGEDKIIFKEIKEGNTRWSHEQPEHSKRFKSLTNPEFENINAR